MVDRERLRLLVRDRLPPDEADALRSAVTSDGDIARAYAEAKLELDEERAAPSRPAPPTPSPMVLTSSTAAANTLPISNTATNGTPPTTATGVRPGEVILAFILAFLAGWLLVILLWPRG